MLDDWVFEMPRAYSRRTGINEKGAAEATAIANHEREPLPLV